MSDLASFDADVILTIFGRSRCRFCGSYEIQGHHVKGRGKMKDPADRKLHSSPLNYCPLCEKCHMFADVHAPELEAYFLRKARESVFYAAAQNKYTLTIIDQAFLQAEGL